MAAKWRNVTLVTEDDFIAMLRLEVAARKGRPWVVHRPRTPSAVGARMMISVRRMRVKRLMCTAQNGCNEADCAKTSGSKKGFLHHSGCEKALPGNWSGSKKGLSCTGETGCCNVACEKTFFSLAGFNDHAAAGGLWPRPSRAAAAAQHALLAQRPVQQWGDRYSTTPRTHRRTPRSPRRSRRDQLHWRDGLLQRGV